MIKARGIKIEDNAYGWHLRSHVKQAGDYDDVLLLNNNKTGVLKLFADRDPFNCNSPLTPELSIK